MEAPASATKNEWTLPLTLIGLTFLSTFFVGAGMVHGGEDMTLVQILSPSVLKDGWVFAVPLMAILMAHEFGHFIAGQKHGVDISPPYFIPLPIVFLGTLGAVIRMRGPIRSRNALLDVGAAGPLAGMVVAVPVLVYGIATSPIEPLPSGDHGGYIIEGRGLLYLGLLYALKGPIPEGHDIMLSPTALAGWAGLLVTMINLIPVAQLDGGHIAYALFGKKQDTLSAKLHRVLPFIAIGVSAIYGGAAWSRGVRGDPLYYELTAGIHWLVWAGLLWLMTRAGGKEHPPTGPEPLSPRRRGVAIFTLGLFVLLFMPSWLRVVPPAG